MGRAYAVRCGVAGVGKGAGVSDNAAPEYGPTERAYRAWVAALGPLSIHQQAVAEQLYVLAAGMDAYREKGDSTAAAAAVARELRQTSAALRDLGAREVPAVPEPVAPAAEPQTADELRRRREERLRQAGAS